MQQVDYSASTCRRQHSYVRVEVVLYKLINIHDIGQQIFIPELERKTHSKQDASDRAMATGIPYRVPVPASQLLTITCKVVSSVL